MTKVESEKRLTILDAIDDTATKEAIRNILTGKTPVKYVKQRPARGGTQVNYVETYYIVDQLNKLFAFKWNFEVLDEQHDEKEIIIKGKLTAYTNDNFPIVKEQFGQVDKLPGVPLGDQKKAASSDCLKKCASLLGIALDVYWGKEIEYFSSDDVDTDNTNSDSEASRAFGKFLSKKRLPVSKALNMLGVSSLDEIKDYKIAHDKILKLLETGI